MQIKIETVEAVDTVKAVEAEYSYPRWTAFGKSVKVYDRQVWRTIIKVDPNRRYTEDHAKKIAQAVAGLPNVVESLKEMLADAEMMNEPFRNEAICERARKALEAIAPEINWEM